MEEKQVVFELAGATYGMNVAQVQSIIPHQESVAVPGAPSFIEGVVNLRGIIIPVVDMRRRFALPAPTNRQKTVIVIVELEHLQVGLMVDKVTEVTKIAATDIEPPSPLLVGVDTAYLRGIGKVGEQQLIILLDPARIFSQDEQQALAVAK
jgi:purine-binding chemotaxis protein CheW